MVALGTKSTRLRPADYERLLAVIADLHTTDAPRPSHGMLDRKPVSDFAARVMRACARLIDDVSMMSISRVAANATHDFDLVTSVRLRHEQPIVADLNSRLSRLVAQNENYRRVREAWVAGATVADVDLMSRRQIENALPFREVYQPRHVSFSAGFAVQRGGRGGYVVATMRHEAPMKPREVALLELLAKHIDRLPAASHPIEAPIATGDASSERLLALGLTPSEARVLYWIAEGKRDGEIALILGNSVRTIHAHVRSVFAKLGVESRAAAMRLAFERLHG